MPFIHTRSSIPLNDATKAKLSDAYKTGCHTAFAKPAEWVMTSFEDDASLFFKGTNEPCAYVEVKILGKLEKGASQTMTEHVCKAMEAAGVPASRTFVAYFGTDHWGWNGNNF